MTTPDSKPRQLSLTDYFLLATFGVALVWMHFGMEHYFGVNFKGRKVAPGEEIVPLWLAIVVTPAVYIGAWIYHRREAKFLSRAVPVTGRVISISMFQIKGLRDITYSYTFGPTGSHTYQSKRSVSSSLLQDLAPGDDVAILVDQSNPGISCLAAE